MKHLLDAVDNVDESLLESGIACDSKEKLDHLVHLEKMKKVRKWTAMTSAVCACLVLFVLMTPVFRGNTAPQLMAKGNTVIALEESLGFSLPDLPPPNVTGKPPVLVGKPHTDNGEAVKTGEKEIENHLVSFYEMDKKSYFAFYDDGMFYCYEGNEKAAKKLIRSLNEIQ